MFYISSKKTLMIMILTFSGVVVYGCRHRSTRDEPIFEYVVIQETGNSLKSTQNMLTKNQNISLTSGRLALLSAYCIKGISSADVMNKALADLQEVTSDMKNLLDVYPYDFYKMVSFQRSLGQSNFLGDVHEQALKIVQDALSCNQNLRNMIYYQDPRFGGIVVQRTCVDSNQVVYDTTLKQYFLSLILKQRTAAEHFNFVLWRIMTQAQGENLAVVASNGC